MRLIRGPVLANYYLTYRCNARCGFCDIWQRPSPYADPDTVRRNLDDLRRLGVRVIDFTGGEPLLHRHLPQYLRWAKERGFITTVTTNTLLYPKRARELKGLVDMLHFSLDSADEATHNASRGVECYAFFVRSLEVALRLGERPDILFTVTAWNIHEIEAVYERFAVPHNLVLILNPVFSYHDIREELGPEALRILRQWARRKNVYLNEAFLRLREEGGNHIDRPVCRAASTSIVISPDDHLILPCYHLEKERIPIRGRLYSLWRSERVQRLVGMEGRYPECEGCVINCYMEPSFSVEVNRYWWWSLPSTLRYAWQKRMWRRLFAR